MPEINDIDKLKDKLNSLGDEPAIMAERGEEIADVQPVSDALPDDISALLGSFGDDLSGGAGDSGAGDEELFSFPGFDDEEKESGMPEDTGGESSAESEEPDGFELPDEEEAGEGEAGPVLPESGPESLEDIFGDSSLDLDEHPDRLIDSFSGEGESETDNLDLGAIDDLFSGETEEAESAGPAETAAGMEAGEDFGFPDTDFDSETTEPLDTGDDSGIPEDLFTSEDEEGFSEDSREEPFEAFDSNESGPEGLVDDDFSLPEDFDSDFADEFEEPGGKSASGTEPEGPGGEDIFGEGFEEPEPESVSGEDAEGEGVLDLAGDNAFAEEPAAPEDFGQEGAASDEDFDIGTLDTISIDDEFEEPEAPLSGEELAQDREREEPEEFGELSEIDEPDFSAAPAGGEEFSLEDLGEEFGNIDELEDMSGGTEPEIQPEVPLSTGSAEGETQEASDEDIYISSEKLGKVTETLSGYPGNLKFYIEDLIGNRELSGENLDTLVESLASGATARQVSEILFKITGKKIRIPAQYERKTWEELEREKATFAYILKNKIIPYTARALVISFALLFVFFVVNNFVWKPLYSTWLYNRGYEKLESEKFRESESYFLRACEVRPERKQFYRYAEKYTEFREYGLAENKYIQLLGISLSSEREKPEKERTFGFFPGDKEGFLKYSGLKTFYQGDFSSSERIIDDFISLKGNKWDYEMLLRKADNYLNWAEIDSAKYNSAEYVINDSLSKFGTEPDFYFRKIALDIRSGNLLEAREKAFSAPAGEGEIASGKKRYYGLLGHYRGYIENIKEKYRDTYIASDFYRYLIDTGEIDGIEKHLIALSNNDKKLIEPHYQLSRLWNLLGKGALERESLENIERLTSDYTVDHIRDNYPHSYMYATKAGKKIAIFTYNRLGNFEYNDGSVLDAQRYFQLAINEYEGSLDLLGSGPEYGHLYEDLGDIYYYNAGKYSEAYREFRNAEATGYRNNNLSYKIGFIHYFNRNYRESAEHFYTISVDDRENESVLFAFANSSYMNGVFSPARAYYEQVMEKLEYWRDHQGMLELERRRDQRVVLEKLMQVYNNLGVTLYRLSEINRNSDYYSNALVYFTKSSELYDLLSRDPETLDRSYTRPLAHLNMRYALMNAGRSDSRVASVIAYSSENMQLDSPIIYNTIDMDMTGRVQLITAR